MNNNKPVNLFRDSGSTFHDMAQKLVNEKRLSDKTIECIRFCGTEIFNLAVVCIDTPYLSGFFEAVILPNPVCDLVLDNLLVIRSPTEGDIQRLNKHNLPTLKNYPTTTVILITRHETNRKK